MVALISTKHVHKNHTDPLHIVRIAIAWLVCSHVEWQLTICHSSITQHVNHFQIDADGIKTTDDTDEYPVVARNSTHNITLWDAVEQTDLIPPNMWRDTVQIPPNGVSSCPGDAYFLLLCASCLRLCPYTLHLIFACAVFIVYCNQEQIWKVLGKKCISLPHPHTLRQRNDDKFPDRGSAASNKSAISDEKLQES